MPALWNPLVFMMRNCDENRYLTPDSQRKLSAVRVILATIVLLTGLGGQSRAELLGVESLVWRDNVTGYAMSGLDPVSYFGLKGPVKGLGDYEHATKHAIWRFANKGNFLAFRSAPKVYQPQFGGYGAYAMSTGKVVEPNPLIWRVSNNRVYLFHSLAARASWISNEAFLAKMAVRNWAEIVVRSTPAKNEKKKRQRPCVSAFGRRYGFCINP